MRIAMYYKNLDVRLEEMPVPEIGPDEILLKVMACGICGSDVMEWYRLHKAPLVLGHEFAGVIEKAGANVKNYKAGQRICVAHHVPCNTCDYCLRGNFTVCDTLRKTNVTPGGFAQYCKIPAINVDRGIFVLPDNVSFEDATFVEPLGCILRAQKKIDLKPADTLLVMGSGISGLLHIHLARQMGVSRIIATDINDSRLSAAKKFGADFAVNAAKFNKEELLKINGGMPADKIILTTGAVSAINQAFDCVERDGTILFFAPTAKDVTVPLSVNNTFWRNNVTLTTSYGAAPADYANAMELISAGRLNLNAMITHRLPLKDAGIGFKLVVDGKESLKVVVNTQE